MKGLTLMHKVTKKQINKVTKDHMQDKEAKVEEKECFT